MAGTVRDLFLAVRVVDRARGPLRAIAGDINRLQATGAAGAGRRATALRAENEASRIQRRRIADEIQSIRTGKLREQSNARLARAEEAVNRADQARITTGQAINRNLQQRLSYQNQLAAAVRGGIIARASETGMFRGKTPTEFARDVDRIRSAQAQALGDQQRLYRQAEQAEANYARSVVNSQAVIAAEEANATRRIEELTAQRVRLRGEEVTRSQTIRRELEVQRRFNQQLRLAQWQGYARGVEHAGHALTIFGLATTAGLGLAANAYVNFSRQATIAATQSTAAGNQTVAQVQKNATRIRSAILSITGAGGVIAGPTEQADAIYQIFSGVTISENQQQQLRGGIRLLREFNKVVTANAGLVTLEEVTRAGIIIMNRFGVSVGQIPRYLNIMQAAVRYGALTMDEFISTLSQAAPAAQGAGYSFTQMSGAIAFISRQFPALRLGTTGYARLLETFGRKDVIAGLRAHGVEITHIVGGVRQLLPLNEIIHRILNQFPQLRQGGVFAQNFFKEMSNQEGLINARRVFISYVKNINEADDILNKVRRDQNELQRAFAAARADPGVQWQEFKVQLQALALEIGQEALPVLIQLGHYVIRAIHWWQSLNASTRETIVKFVAIAGVVSLLSGVILTLVGAIASLYIALKLRAVATGIAAIAGEAGAARVAASGLLLNLLKIKNLGLITIVITLILSKGLRDQAEDLWSDMAHGRMNWQRRFDRWLQEKKHQIIEPFTHIPGAGRLFEVGTQRPGPLDFMTEEQERRWEHFARNRELQNRRLFDPYTRLRRLERGRAQEARTILGTATATARGVPYTKQFQNLFDQVGRAREQLDRFRAGQRRAIAAGNMQAYARATESANIALATLNETLKRFNAYVSSNAINVGKERIKALTDTAQQLGVMKISPSFIQLFDQVADAQARMIDAQNRLGRADTPENRRKALRAAEHYFAAQKRLQAFANDQQEQAASKSLTTLRQNQQDALNQQKQDFKDTIDSVQSMYDDLLQKNRSIFGQLFQGPMQGLIEFRRQWGAAPTGGMLLRDLQGQIRMFTRFENALTNLRRRGAPPELIQQLREQGIDALPNILALTRMPPSVWRSYVNAFKQGDALVKRQTMRDLNEQLALYRKFGNNVGEAIRQGIADKEPGLRREIRALVLQMFPELRPGGTTQRTSGAGTATNTTNVKVDNHHPVTVQGPHEDVRTALAKHRNRIRNRPGYQGPFVPGGH